MNAQIRFHAVLVASFAACLSVSGVAFAAQALTLAEAQRRALEIAPQVSGQNAAIRASREMAVAVGRRPDPVLKIGVENVPVDGPDRFTIGTDFMTMRRIGVMQEVTAGDKLTRRSERYEREAEKGEAEMEGAIATVQRETALAWLETYYAEAMANATTQQREEAKREVDAAEANYRAGRGAQADVFAARGALILVEDRLSEVQKRVATSRTTLARWVGPAANEPLVGTPAFDQVPEELFNEHVQLEHHPEVLAASKSEQIAAAEVRVAQANRVPDWTWELAYSRRGSPFSDMVSIGVSVPVAWDRADKQDREVAAKLALAQQAASQREDILRMHTVEVKTMVAEWQSGMQRRRRIAAELLPLSEQRTQAALAAYRGGKGTLVEVLAARRSELDARLQMLQLDLETARAWARLNFLYPANLAKRHLK